VTFVPQRSVKAVRVPQFGDSCEQQKLKGLGHFVRKMPRTLARKRCGAVRLLLLIVHRSAFELLALRIGSPHQQHGNNA
jgi:hypothetical protein